MKLMYNCREMVDLISRELDSKLSLSVKMKMAMHLSMCAGCRSYRDQINHVEKLIKNYYLEENINENIHLSEEAKGRIEKHLVSI